MKHITYLLLIALAIMSCGEKSPCLKGCGENTTSIRQLNNFNELELNDNFHVVISQSVSNMATLEGGKNLLPHITTKVENNKLVISNNNKCDFVRKNKTTPIIYLELNELNKLTVYGNGTINFIDTLHTDNLEIECFESVGDCSILVKTMDFSLKKHTGSMNFDIKGQANNSYIYSATTSHIHAKDFVSDSSFLHIEGFGDITTSVNYQLDIFKKSYGNIHYFGNPEVTIQQNLGEGIIKGY